MEEIDIIMARFNRAAAAFHRHYVSREVEKAIAYQYTQPELLEALKVEARAGDEAIAAELRARGVKFQ